ncbi:ribonuclease H-like domain-containing protein [Tanacetum coccineum]
MTSHHHPRPTIDHVLPPPTSPPLPTLSPPPELTSTVTAGLKKESFKLKPEKSQHRRKSHSLAGKSVRQQNNRKSLPTGATALPESLTADATTRWKEVAKTKPGAMHGCRQASYTYQLDVSIISSYVSVNNNMLYRLPHPGQGILGPAPAIYASQPTPLPSAFSTMPLQDPTWHMDTGASSHLNFNASNLSTIFDKRLFPSVHVGDGKSIPVTNTGHSIIPSHHRPLHLHNVLVTPNIIKNLISVRQFTRDNNCTIEFDAFGFSVKDYLTRHILLRCDSSSDLYPVTKPSTSPIAFLSTSASTWHQRLGHPGDQVLRSLVSSRFISCNKEKSSHICHACQLGKHVKLPFHSSDSIVEHCFDIIHSDLWTSPIISSSGFKYYVLFLDHFSHFLWIYPLRSKSDMFDKFLHFRNYVKNQFKCEIKNFQCDHGGYPAYHRGFRCLNLETNKIILSRHVTFDETQFPYKSMTPSSPPSYTFLDTQRSPLLTSLASKLPNPSTNIPHQTSIPTAPPITDPTQSPPHTGPNSPGPTFPTNQPTSHEPNNIQTQTQNNPLPPPIFDPPNPQTNTNPVNEPPRTHPMITRSQSGIVKPIERLSLHTSSLSPIPKSPFIALKDPNWCNAMYDEYNALVKNGTWILVPRPSDVNLVRSMWLFKHKFHADGTLSRYKARLVANGSNQQHGVDFDETFSLFVKPATIRTVLSLAVSRQWPIHQLDVKNAFLNGDISETVYMHQPPSFVDSRYPNHVCLLQRSLYGLKQAPRAWFQRFAASSLVLLNYFLGISAVCHPTGLFLSQKKYARQLLEQAHMVNWGLQYLTFTRLDLSYAVQQVCLYMHDLREPHFAALKRILRYVQGTLELGLQLYASATTSLVGYTDADWAGYPSTRRSTSCSSAKAEYRGVANVVAETAWIRNLLRELHSPLLTATLVYCDNVSAVYMSANPVQHQRTEHIEIDIHFVRDMVKAGHVRVLHVPSHFQYADIFIKGLPSALFEDFRSSLSIRPPPAPTAGAY